MVEAAADPAIARAELQLQEQRALAEKAMRMALGVKEDGSEESAKQFAVLSRIVRLTHALEARTGQAVSDLKAGRAPAPKTPQEHRKACRKRISRLVMEAADRECETPDAFDALVAALNERLDDDEAYLDITERPLGETIERLCRDLTLDPDLSRWDGEGWIDDGPPPRPPYSIFNTPSARPLMRGPEGEKLDTPAPPRRLHSLE